MRLFALVLLFLALLALSRPQHLTTSALDRKAAAQEALLSRLSRPILADVDSSVADAAAHAAKALTDTLKRRPDGRPTIRHARDSRSTKAASHRLDELLSRLAGPSIDSTEGSIRDARVSLYVDALSRWAKLLPADVLRPDPATARAAEVLAVRRLALHGSELRTEIGAPITDAIRRLQATLGQAGRRTTGEGIAADLVDAWATRTRGAIGRAVRTALADGFYRLDVAAGWHAVRPELRDGDDPLA